jgi:hypothetical protein
MENNLQLEDIILPPAIPELSSGQLFGIAIACLLLVFVIAFWIYHRYQQRRFCRLALGKLAAMDDATIAALWPVNQLLKQVIRAYSPHFSGAIDGQAWYQFLTAQLPTRKQKQVAALQVLADSNRFQANYHSQHNSDALRCAVSVWLQHCRLDRKRVKAWSTQLAQSELRRADA